MSSGGPSGHGESPRRSLRGRVRWEARQAARLVGASRNMLPTVLIIGAQKGGTTSLHHYLVQHPDVGAPRRKEIHYFDLNADRSPLWYRSHLPPRGSASHTLDSSPYYLYHPAVPRRAHDLLPDAKLIVLLRDPVKRAYSHYQHSHAEGHETLTFADALAAEQERLAGAAEHLLSAPDARSFPHQYQAYVDRGLYAPQIRRWREHYAPEQMLILSSEDMFADPAAILTRVQRWLGLSEQLPGAPLAARNTRSYPPLDPALAASLSARFREDRRELEALTGLTFEWR